MAQSIWQLETSRFDGYKYVYETQSYFSTEDLAMQASEMCDAETLITEIVLDDFDF